MVGAGQDSNLRIQGSDVSAGNDIHLKADNQIKLLAAQNTHDMQRDSSSQSANVGVAATYGSGGWAFGITANASASKGDGSSHDVVNTNTHVAAGNTLRLESGGDTTIKGATASGNRVVADVGGNLNIESLQDTSTYQSKDQSISGSVTVGYGFAASANAGQQQINSDYASVTEQSGIKAGDGGFNVSVKGNTDLKGGGITSSQTAVDIRANSMAV